MRAPAALLASLFCLPLSATAEPFQDAFEENPYLFNEELRMLLHDEPDILASALARGAELRSDAVFSPLRSEIETDLSRITALSDDLFRTTPQGFGAEGRAKLALFTQLNCTECARAEAELQDLVAQTPGLRVELRSLTTALPDRLSYVIAHVAGAAAAQDFRSAVNKMGATDDVALASVLSSLGHDPEALRIAADAPATMDALTQEARMFNSLGLDTAPSYVMPRMLIRGHMPAMVLSKYLARP
ncbi:thioredoxin domain-containing protein [Pseudooceanicola spongiae]|uniref:Thioredoxin-like fold domain-containing protein n=1 Tax=Pseudooceanicola spongiae TaxID=2613965 RepID=A0A7L9WKK7_9RHOB|nr:hypothetical protein [Pseudooceanicola spongiae]QOL80364.1 hypothetical protein F3W81_05725 [Pseudooceanicola spongiae]